MTYGEATLFLDWIIAEYLDPRDGEKAQAALNAISDHFRELVQKSYEDGVKDGRAMAKVEQEGK